MIFPIPIKEQYFEHTYCLKQEYDLRDLYQFYLSHKAGSKDITFFAQPELAPEEYEINIDDQGIQISFSEEQGRFRALTDRIVAEYHELWIAENYEEGVEIFENYLLDRKQELADFLKES